MKKLMIAALCAVGMTAAIEAAPTDGVTQADLKAILERMAKLENENKALQEKVAKLEGAKTVAAKPAESSKAEGAAAAHDQGTEVSESGRVFTTAQGFQYYLADKAAGIFEPLSESGLKITPYGWLIFEADHNTHKTAVDTYTDWVLPRRNGRHNGDHQTVFSMQNSILGLKFETPELVDGWKVSGKAEFDFAGDNSNDYAFHWRHLYFDIAREDDGWGLLDSEKGSWSFLFGQTWHLWKMVTPNEIDGAWMENTGHPYRRSPQIRVTRRLEWDDSSLEIRAGLVKNGPGMGGDRDSDENEDNAASAWALVEGAIVYDHKAFWQDKDDNLAEQRWLFGVGGMYGRDKSRRFVYDDGDDEEYTLGQSDEYDSDMIMVAGQIPFGRFTLTGQLFAGENLGGVQAGIGQKVGFRDLEHRGREVSTIGGFIDLKYVLNKKWDFAIGYGFDDPTDSEAKYAEDRVFNERAYADVFYHIFSNFRLGFEYAHLRTKYYADGDADDDRFQFAAFYDF